MKQQHRSTVLYYKQIYNFAYLIATYAHASWLTSLAVPAKVATNKQEKTLFQSNVLLHGIEPLTPENMADYSILLFISSLSKAKFNRFLNYVVLSLLKHDRSLLINGTKLKNLSEVFSKEEMEFLLLEKEVKFNLTEKINLSTQFDLNLDFFEQLALYILRSFCLPQHGPLFDRIKYRFPKGMQEQVNHKFNFKIDLDNNIECLSIIAQVLFPAAYEIFEQENQQLQALYSENSDNAYKVSSLSEGQ